MKGSPERNSDKIHREPATILTQIYSFFLNYQHYLS